MKFFCFRFQSWLREASVRFSASVVVTEPVVVSSASMNERSAVSLWTNNVRVVRRGSDLKRRTWTQHSMRGSTNDAVSTRAPPSISRTHSAGMEVGHGEANLLVRVETSGGSVHLAECQIKTAFVFDVVAHFDTRRFEGVFWRKHYDTMVFSAGVRTISRSSLESGR